MEVKVSHSSEPVEVDGIRIKIHDKEFLLQQVADGLKIVEITHEEILVRPQVANSIVLVTRIKK